MISNTNQNGIQKFTGEVLRYAYNNAPSRDQIASNVRTVAIPAIAMGAAMRAQEARAFDYNGCVEACEKIEWEPATMACWIFCLIMDLKD